MLIGIAKVRATALSILIGVTASECALAVTIDQAYDAARGVALGVRNQELKAQIAETRYDQAKGSLMPSLRAISTSEWNENPSPFARGNYVHTARLNATQPIFQGGAEYYALAGSKLEIENAKLSKAWDEWLLFETVANIFIDIVQLETDVGTLANQVDLLESRMKAIRARTSIGRSSPAELSATASQLARTRAELLLRKADLDAKRKDFAYQTGLPEHSKLIDQSLSEEVAKFDVSEEQVMRHPAVQLLESRLETSDTGIKQARAGYLPTVDLQGNYYFERQGFNRTSNWDITVNVTWEFFSGLTTKHEVLAKNLERSTFENQLTDTKRQYATQLSTLRSDVHNRRATVEQLKEAVRLAEQYVKEQKQDFDRGLLSNLELMRAMDELLQIRRTYDRERMELQRSALRLKHLGGKSV